MIRHIFLDKTATIIKDLHVNTGLNPVAELNYGQAVTRILLHFDESKIKEMVEDKTISDLSKVKFTLKMTNTAGIDGVPYEKPLKFGNTCITKERASSFTLLALKLPCGFDEGRGFEYLSDVWITKNKSYSTDGCNWYQCYNGKAWPEEGVYSPVRIKEEYEKFYSDDEEARKSSIVLDRQRFDFGDETLQIDLTNYVLGILKGEPNYGIMLCFSPLFEVLNGVAEFKELKADFAEASSIEFAEYNEMPSMSDITVPDYFKVVMAVSDEIEDSGTTESGNTIYSGDTVYSGDTGTGITYVTKYYKRIKNDVNQQYVGFFTDHTNTFFHPYVEVFYDESIMDDREAFYPGKVNRLYLYSNIGGKPENLDELPVCMFEGVAADVKQVTKGVYCAEILLTDHEPDVICYDVWSNLKYQGVEQDDVELETVILPRNEYFKIGSGQPKIENLVPSVYGINDDEGVKRGDVREVVVDFRKKYTTNERQTTTDAYYRLYVLDGEREIDILNGYQPVERTFLHNYFVLYTEDLIPNKKYYVDIKVKSGREEKFFKNVLHFKVIDDVTERYA